MNAKRCQQRLEKAGRSLNLREAGWGHAPMSCWSLFKVIHRRSMRIFWSHSANHIPSCWDALCIRLCAHKLRFQTRLWWVLHLLGVTHVEVLLLQIDIHNKGPKCEMWFHHCRDLPPNAPTEKKKGTMSIWKQNIWFPQKYHSSSIEATRPFCGVYFAVSIRWTFYLSMIR